MSLQMARAPSFFMAYKIPLYICTTSLCICLMMDSWVASILAIINNAAVNIGVHISFRISVLCFLG